MVRDIQIIIAIIVMVWFYLSAKTVGKNPGWVIIGALAFFMPGVLINIFIRLVIVPIIPPGLIT